MPKLFDKVTSQGAFGMQRRLQHLRRLRQRPAEHASNLPPRVPAHLRARLPVRRKRNAQVMLLTLPHASCTWHFQCVAAEDSLLIVWTVELAAKHLAALLRA